MWGKRMQYFWQTSAEKREERRFIPVDGIMPGGYNNLNMTLGKQGERGMLKVLIADDESKVCQLIESWWTGMLLIWRSGGRGEQDRCAEKDKGSSSGYRDHGHPDAGI